MSIQLESFLMIYHYPRQGNYSSYGNFSIDKQRECNLTLKSISGSKANRSGIHAHANASQAKLRPWRVCRRYNV